MTFKNDSGWLDDPTTYPSEAIIIADVMSIGTNSTPGNSSNSITINLGCAATGEMFSQQAIMFSPPGFISLPVGPGTIPPATGVIPSTGNVVSSNTSTSAAQVLALFRDDQYIVLGTRDTRTQDRPGNAGPGDTVMYAQQGQAEVVCKADGSVSMMTTTTGDGTGKNMILTLSTNGLYFASPFGSLAFDAAGFRISLSSGASLNLSGTADPTSGNQFTVSSGSTTISSGIITLGTPANTIVPFGAVYGTIPAVIPGIPILGEGVGAVTVNAAASTTVFIGV